MPKPILIDLTEADGTIRSILADNITEARTIVSEELSRLHENQFYVGFTIKVSDGQAFLDNLDEPDQE